MKNKTDTSTGINVSISSLEPEHILDPVQIGFVTEYYYLENMTLRLIRLDKNRLYIEDLANSIEIKNNKTDLYFTIKEAYFSDGKRITLEDVLKTFKRVTLLGSSHSNPKSFIRGSEQLKSIEDEIEGLEIVGDKIHIGLKHPMKEIFYFLQMADYGILHPDQYKKGKLSVSDWTKANSGAYRLNFDNGSVNFIRNDRFLNFNERMPKLVRMVRPNNENIIDRIKKSEIDLGVLTFENYHKNYQVFNSLKNYVLFGGNTDGIVHINLNIKSKKFSNDYLRRWIYKKILTSFNVRSEQDAYMKKATQYFLPNAKGYIKDAEVESYLSDIDVSQIPQVLKDEGLTIRTLETMKPYLPDNFESDLSKAIEIPVKIKFDIQFDDYVNDPSKRDYDAFIIATAMSYKVLGETLNLQYTSNDASFLDPTGKVKSLLEIYQKEDDPTKESNIINEILIQMIRDSECVPVFYIATPKFYNTDKLDVSELHLDESLEFWRLRVK